MSGTTRRRLPSTVDWGVRVKGRGRSDEQGSVRLGRDAESRRRGRGKLDSAPDPDLPTPAAAHGGPRLGELLLERERITADDLTAALVRQEENGIRLGQALVELGALDERSLTIALAQQRGIDVVDLRRESPDAETLAALRESVARGLGALPLRGDEDAFAIVVADAARPGIELDLSRAVGGPLKLLLAPPSDLRRAIDRSYRALAGVDEFVRNFELTAAAAALRGTHRTSGGSGAARADRESGRPDPHAGHARPRLRRPHRAARARAFRSRAMVRGPRDARQPADRASKRIVPRDLVRPSLL